MFDFEKKKRKRITVATTISASGAIKAGGTNVVNGVYTNLAKFCDVDIIYIAPVNEKFRRYEIAEGITELVIPKTKLHYEKEREITLKTGASTTYDISLMHCLKYTPQYGEELRKSINQSDAVFLERPFLFNEVKKYVNGRPLFHRSQNIEYFFRKSNMPSNDASRKLLKELYDLEQKCCEFSELSFACSEEDLSTMHDMYKISSSKLRLIPNGCSCDENPYVSIEKRSKLKKMYGLDNEKMAVFIGGGHKPNMEACEFILRIAVYCKDVKFVFAGPLCNILMKRKLPSNVVLLGFVTEETRKYLLSVADMALNPMFSGSGSNIKMFDYMAMGVPVITSFFGARGICNKEYFHIADTANEFIDIIKNFDLLNEKQNVIRARKMVEENYDYAVIAEKLFGYIENYL